MYRLFAVLVLIVSAVHAQSDSLVIVETQLAYAALEAEAVAADLMPDEDGFKSAKHRTEFLRAMKDSFKAKSAYYQFMIANADPSDKQKLANEFWAAKKGQAKYERQYYASLMP